MGGYTDGTRFFFADEQLTDIARAAGGGVLFRSPAGWRQLGATPQALPRHIIHSQLHYQLPDDWHWRQIQRFHGRHSVIGFVEAVVDGTGRQWPRLDLVAQLPAAGGDPVGPGGSTTGEPDPGPGDHQQDRRCGDTAAPEDLSTQSTDVPVNVIAHRRPLGNQRTAIPERCRSPDHIGPTVPHSVGSLPGPLRGLWPSSVRNDAFHRHFCMAHAGLALPRSEPGRNIAVAGVVDGRPHPVSQIAAAIDRRRGWLSFVMCTRR